jgi:hypothetical protein
MDLHEGTQTVFTIALHTGLYLAIVKDLYEGTKTLLL